MREDSPNKFLTRLDSKQLQDFIVQRIPVLIYEASNGVDDLTRIVTDNELTCRPGSGGGGEARIIFPIVFYET